MRCCKGKGRGVSCMALLIVPQNFSFHASLQKPALNQSFSPEGILKLSPRPRALKG